MSFTNSLRKGIVKVLDTLKGVVSGSTSDYYPSKQFQYMPELQLYQKDSLESWEDRDDVARKDPLARFICYKIPETVFDDGFKWVDRDGKPIDDLNNTVYPELEKLEWRRVFAMACKYQRIHRWSAIYLEQGVEKDPSYPDTLDITDLVKTPLLPNAVITGLHPFAGDRDIKVWRVGPLGRPKEYVITVKMTQSGHAVQERYFVHHSRIIVINPHPVRYGQVEGEGALDPIWDDLVLYRWTKYYMCFSAIKYGGGIAKFKRETGGSVPSEEKTAIDAVAHKISQATGVTLPGNWDLTWESPSGQTAYSNYLDSLLNTISAGCGVPKVMLKGAEAGSLTSGSTNERELYATVSNILESFEPFIKRLTLVIFPEMVEKLKDAYFDWAFDFTLDAKGQAEVDLLLAQEKSVRLSWVTPNEIREEEGKDPIDGGDELQSMSLMSGEFGFEEQQPPQPSKREKEIVADFNKKNNTNLKSFKEVDLYVTGKGHSITKTCKDLKMGKATYYDLRRKYARD